MVEIPGRPQDERGIRYSAKRKNASRGQSSGDMSSVVVVLASSVLLTAQNVVLTGALSGGVTDQSGAVVTGASVVVQNLGTSVKQSAETNHTGLYRFLAFTPGSYSIAVSLKGFRNVQAGPVRVLIGNTAQPDVKL